MPDPKRPNQDPFVPEEKSTLPTEGYEGADERKQGISNRPAPEELEQQKELPDRGHAKKE